MKYIFKFKVVRKHYILFVKLSIPLRVMEPSSCFIIIPCLLLYQGYTHASNAISNFKVRLIFMFITNIRYAYVEEIK